MYAGVVMAGANSTYKHCPSATDPVEGPVQGAPASADQQQAREQVEGFPSSSYAAGAHPVLREEFCLPYDCNFTIW